MEIVKGTYTSAKVFTDKMEDHARAQIQLLCDNEAFSDCKVRVMPDVHPGKVGTIGFTATVGKMVLPNVVGIDIGCGILLARLKQKQMEFQKLDKVIRECIPSGFSVRKKPHRYAEEFDFTDLYCWRHVNQRKAELSMGTLGGGNHFIEADQAEDGGIYVAIHTGSRHLGKEVTEYYLREGQKELKERGLEVPYELTYLRGKLMEQYLHDTEVVQRFADLNREVILSELAKGMKWKIEQCSSCVHNYIDTSKEEKIIRKGAISAHKGERVVIPVNMKDGILLGEGLGNEDWNESAPHGAGRIRKREEVKASYTVSQFKAEMKGIYCSCIGRETLDEAPFAYRGLDEIREAVQETVRIQQILKPIYNFKAGSEK